MWPCGTATEAATIPKMELMQKRIRVSLLTDSIIKIYSKIYAKWASPFDDAVLFSPCGKLPLGGKIQKPDVLTLRPYQSGSLMIEEEMAEVG